MVTNVTSLLKTVKAVEDEATKGTRALEATTEHIRQELAVSTHRGCRASSQSGIVRAAAAPHMYSQKCKQSHTFPRASPDFSSGLRSGFPSSPSHSAFYTVFFHHHPPAFSCHSGLLAALGCGNKPLFKKTLSSFGFRDTSFSLASNISSIVVIASPST